jgi:hypothetical protein
VQRQHAYVGGGLQPGAALVVVCLAVVTLPPRSTTPTVAGCCLVGCSVVSGRPLRSRAVAGLSRHVCVCLGPVLASYAPSPLAAVAAAWRGRGRVPIVGWSYGGVGPERGLRGGGRRGCGYVKKMLPVTPVIGVASTCLLVGSAVAHDRAPPGGRACGLCCSGCTRL